MALLTVGIHENLVLGADSKINDKGTLELVIESVSDDSALLNAFKTNTTFDKMKGKIIFYPPMMSNYDKTTKSAAEVAKDVLAMRHKFMEYGKLFATKDAVNAAIGDMQMFQGIGIADDALDTAPARLANEDFVKKVVTNLSTKFLNFLKKVDAFKGDVKFRHKFLRQSKDKNYPVVPNSTYEVWVESMDIPKSASKVEYSKWEIENNKNNPDPVVPDASQTKTEDVNKGKNLFGGGTVEDKPAM